MDLEGRGLLNNLRPNLNSYHHYMKFPHTKFKTAISNSIFLFCHSPIVTNETKSLRQDITTLNGMYLK